MTWTVCAVVVNSWLKRFIELNYVMNLFLKGRDTGAAILESNLAHQLAGLSQEPIFRCSWMSVKLMTHSTEGDACEIIKGNGLGLNLSHLLTHDWGQQQQIIPKAEKFVGKVFGTEMDNRQGEPSSSMILNIVVDVMVRVVLEEV